VSRGQSENVISTLHASESLVFQNHNAMLVVLFTIRSLLASTMLVKVGGHLVVKEGLDITLVSLWNGALALHTSEKLPTTPSRIHSSTPTPVADTPSHQKCKKCNFLHYYSSSRTQFRCLLLLHIAESSVQCLERGNNPSLSKRPLKYSQHGLELHTNAQFLKGSTSARKSALRRPLSAAESARSGSTLTK
jgi:hypothetical protein